jgi:hypothetical protein
MKKETSNMIVDFLLLISLSLMLWIPPAGAEPLPGFEDGI